MPEKSMLEHPQGVVGEYHKLLSNRRFLSDADNLKRLLYVPPKKRARFKACAKCGLI